MKFNFLKYFFYLFKPLKNEHFRLTKSRYSSVDCYISSDSAIYNDVDVVRDDDAFHKLIENGKIKNG
jgi:glutamate--cysteine ligase catalytic subunit